MIVVEGHRVGAPPWSSFGTTTTTTTTTDGGGGDHDDDDDDVGGTSWWSRYYIQGGGGGGRSAFVMMADDGCGYGRASGTGDRVEYVRCPCYVRRMKKKMPDGSARISDNCVVGWVYLLT